MRSKLLLLLLFPSTAVLAQSNSLPARETLSYDIEWRLITAGRVKLEWVSVPAPRPAWQINLNVESVGLVSKLFKVEDNYSAILSPALCAQSSFFNSHEGSRERETRITFDAEARKAAYLERDRVKSTVLLQRETDIPACVHDIAGALYALRTLNLEPGQSTALPVTDGKKSAMVRVEAQQREDVKTPDGAYHTVRYEAYLFNNVLFHRQAHAYVWLSDDRRKLPVQIRVRMPITIGTITLQLEKHE